MRAFKHQLDETDQLGVCFLHPMSLHCNTQDTQEQTTVCTCVSKCSMAATSCGHIKCKQTSVWAHPFDWCHCHQERIIRDPGREVWIQFNCWKPLCWCKWPVQDTCLYSMAPTRLDGWTSGCCVLESAWTLPNGASDLLPGIHLDLTNKVRSFK